MDPLEVEVFFGLFEKSRSIAHREGLAQREALGQLLSLAEPNEIARFKKRFDALSSLANLFKVHKVIGGADDGQGGGAGGLVAMGKMAYERLWASPCGRAQGRDFEGAASDAFEEPTRSWLRVLAIARRESEILEGSVAVPGASKSGPRV